MDRDERFERLEPWSLSVAPEVVLRGWSSGHERSKNTCLHFIHGNGFSSLTYATMLSELAGQYDLFLQDVAGHGDSDADERFVGWNETAARCGQVFEQFHLTNRPVVGLAHSFGGCITALMAAQQPHWFERLILLDPALFPPKLLWILRGMKLSGLVAHVPLAKQARKRQAAWSNRKQLESYFTGRGVFRGWCQASLEDYFQHALKQSSDGQYQLKCPPSMEAAIFASYPKKLWYSFRKLSTPTLIVMGEDTFPFFREAYTYAAKINPKIQLLEVKGGHCFMQERPQETAGLILSLLNKEASISPHLI